MHYSIHIVPDPPEFESSPYYQDEKLINIQTTWIHNMVNLILNLQIILYISMAIYMYACRALSIHM